MNRRLDKQGSQSLLSVAGPHRDCALAAALRCQISLISGTSHQPTLDQLRADVIRDDFKAPRIERHNGSDKKRDDSVHIKKENESKDQRQEDPGAWKTGDCGIAGQGQNDRAIPGSWV